MKKIKLTPKDKICKAIFGDKYKTEAEKEAQLEADIKAFSEKVKAMSNEEFEKTFGYTRQQEKERTRKMMDEIHWMDCVIRYQLDVNGGAKNPFSMRDAAAIANYFYFKGREHQQKGLDFDFNGHEVKAENGWEVKKDKEAN